MRLARRVIDFMGDHDRDQGYMAMWERCQLDADSGAVFMSDNNRIRPRLTADEFVEIAHKCGYWRSGTLPTDTDAACKAYEERKRQK